MSSVPTSPVSPSRRRRSFRLSDIDVLHDESQSRYISGTTDGTTFSRRSSRTSQTSLLQSPTTPRPASIRSSRPPSFYDRRKSSSRLSIGSNISTGTTDGGLGNLADELEDALEDEYEGNSSFLEDTREGSTEPSIDLTQNHWRSVDGADADLSVRPQSPSSIQEALQPTTPRVSNTSKAERRKSRHQRTQSKYDGSDYGPDSDLDEDGFSPSLARRMGDIESLVRMGINTEDALSEGGGAIKRTTHALRDLGPQSVIETNLTRMISAYTSMATHRTNKTRDVFNQAHSLLYGSNPFDLPPSAVDTLLGDLDLLTATIPIPTTTTHPQQQQHQQQQNPLLSLQLLATQTLDLAHTLRSLADALQESRVQAAAAARQLKTVRDMVDDVCTERRLVETSVLLIQAGDWDRRCRERQAAATCREVVCGFGESWGLNVEVRPWMVTAATDVGGGRGGGDEQQQQREIAVAVAS